MKKKKNDNCKKKIDKCKKNRQMQKIIDKCKKKQTKAKKEHSGNN